MKYCYSLIIVLSFILVECHTGRGIYKDINVKGNDSVWDVQSINRNKKYEEYLKIGSTDNKILGNGKELRFDAGLAIKRDNLLVMSLIPAAGIEVLRIYCMRDSILILNRKEKTYYENSLREFFLRYNIELDLKDIQALCSNEFFIYGQDGLNVPDITHEEKGNNVRIVEYMGKTPDNNEFKQVIYYNTGYRTIEKIMVLDEKYQLFINILYQNYKQIGRNYFPGKIFVEVKSRKYDIKVEMNIRKIELEKEIRTEIEIPGNYKSTEL